MMCHLSRFDECCHIFVGECDNTSFVVAMELPVGEKNVTTSQNVEVADV